MIGAQSVTANRISGIRTPKNLNSIEKEIYDSGDHVVN